jgi:hypothetical protein
VVFEVREGLLDEEAAWNREAGLVQTAEFGAGVEADIAGDEVGTDDQLVAAEAAVRVPAELDVAAEGVLLRVGAVDRGAERVLGGRDRVAVRIQYQLLFFLFLFFFFAFFLVVVIVIIIAFADEAFVLRRHAFAEVRVVTIEGGDVAAAVVRVPAEFQRAVAVLAAEVHGEQFVLGLVRTREDRVAIDGGELKRNRAVTDEVRVGIGEVDGYLARISLPADVGEEAGGPGGREVAPAVLFEVVAVDVIAEGAVGAERIARFHVGDDAVPGAAGELGGGALVAEAVLGADADGAAEAVQPEHRERTRDQLHAVDSGLRHQRPVDRVTERLVQAHAVLVHGQALGKPQQWRGGVAPELDVGLQRVRRAFVDEDAGEIGVHVGGEVEQVLLGNLLTGCRLHVRRHLGCLYAGAERCDPDDENFVIHLRLLSGGGQYGGKARDRGREHARGQSPGSGHRFLGNALQSSKSCGLAARDDAQAPRAARQHTEVRIVRVSLSCVSAVGWEQFPLRCSIGALVDVTHCATEILPGTSRRCGRGASPSARQAGSSSAARGERPGRPVLNGSGRRVSSRSASRSWPPFCR